MLLRLIIYNLCNIVTSLYWGVQLINIFILILYFNVKKHERELIDVIIIMNKTNAIQPAQNSSCYTTINKIQMYIIIKILLSDTGVLGCISIWTVLLIFDVKKKIANDVTRPKCLLKKKQ